jgi:uncharacterized membrane protein
MLTSIPLWLHLMAASVWVGSQIMMFAVVIPSVRKLPESAARIQVLTPLTTRFGWLGAAALIVLAITGVDNISRYSPGDMFDIRYGYILATKLSLLGLVLLLTLYHTLYVGPRQLRFQAQAAERPGTIDSALLVRTRVQSIVISVLTLLLSLAVLFCAALLRSVFAQRLV